MFNVTVPSTVAELYEDMLTRLKLMALAAKIQMRAHDDLAARVGKLEAQVGKLVAAE
ncbi:hypothetical protein [Nocardia sp. IFM 10818]